jgi:hypothetical protein
VLSKWPSICIDASRLTVKRLYDVKQRRLNLMPIQQNLHLNIKRNLGIWTRMNADDSLQVNPRATEFRRWTLAWLNTKKGALLSALIAGSRLGPNVLPRVARFYQKSVYRSVVAQSWVAKRDQSILADGAK